jgi:hypothetical protein
MKSGQLTTISFFRFKGFNAYWGFIQMQWAIHKLKQVPGLEFSRYMGSGGKKGFSKTVNFNVYALLCVWENEAAASDFFERSSTFNAFRSRSDETWTIHMATSRAHGAWSKRNPFRDFEPYQGGPVAVITRATIKWKYLFKFWKFVPSVSATLDQQAGLLFAIGIGEYPWFMQATFSIWDNYESVKQYAYQTKHHSEVVKKTRELGWYSEEMFINFIPIKSQGSWLGDSPLDQYLPHPTF